MDILLTAVAFVVIFSILVLIHEGGHFMAARKAGIKVEEFGFGLPPRIWGRKKGETLYSINAIPFGGFVKLLGEDNQDRKTIKDKRSFSAKPPRVRIMVVVAGVLMNYLLALVLLSIGFSFGIQPLILSGDDVLANIDNGTIQIKQGILVHDVVSGGQADLIGIKAGDRINSINGREMTSADQLQQLLRTGQSQPISLDIMRDGKAYRSQISAGEKQGLGFSTYDIMFLPRIAVQDVKADAASFKAGLKAGDVILSINGKPVYFIEDFEDAIAKSPVLEVMVDRNSVIENVKIEHPRKDLVVVSSVFDNTPAVKAGFKKGDIIVSLDDTVVSSPEQAVAYTKDHALKDIKYKIERNGQDLFISVAPQQSGLIGVGLSSIYAFENDDLSVYSMDVPTSVIKINNISYPFWIAPLKAVEESGRLAVLTVQMFTGVLKSVVTSFTVPEGVAGVVGIAQLTHQFVQEGALPLLRFMALLSLSLAIINIFPFPALDGGKLLFIIWEVITGKRVNARFEAIVSMIGFALLMLLILLITYNDILRVFF